MPLKPLSQWASRKPQRKNVLPRNLPPYVRVPKNFRNMMTDQPSFVTRGHAVVGPDLVKWAQFDVDLKTAAKQEAYQKAFSLNRMLKKHPRLTRVRFSAKSGSLVHVGRDGQIIDPNAPPPISATHEYPWARWAGDNPGLVRSSKVVVHFLRKMNGGLGQKVANQMAQYFVARNEDEARRLQLPYDESVAEVSDATAWGVGDTHRSIAGEALESLMSDLEGRKRSRGDVVDRLGGRSLSRRNVPSYSVDRVGDEPATLDALMAAERFAEEVAAMSFEGEGAGGKNIPTAVHSGTGFWDAEGVLGGGETPSRITDDRGAEGDGGSVDDEAQQADEEGESHVSSTLRDVREGLQAPPVSSLTSGTASAYAGEGGGGDGGGSPVVAAVSGVNVPHPFPWEHTATMGVEGVGATSGHRALAVGGVDPNLRSTNEWAALRVPQSLQSVLKEHALPRPSRCQSMAVPAILNGVDALVCAQTGTGKTLAAVLPVCMRLQRDSQFYGLSAEAGSPRAIFLSPSNELVEQTSKWVEMVAAPLGLTHAVLTGGRSTEVLVHTLVKPVDIIITTPSLLSRLLWLTRTTAQSAAGPRMDLGRTRYVVLDEADWLLSPGDNAYTQDVVRDVCATCLPEDLRTPAGDAAEVRRFEQLCDSVLKTKHQAPMVPQVGQLMRPLQFVLLCATPNSTVRGWFEGHFPRGVTVAEPTIFQARSRLKQEVIYCRPREKLSVTLNLLGACGHRFFDPSVAREGLFSVSGGLHAPGRGRSDTAVAGQDISSASLSLWFNKGGGTAKPVGKRVIVFVNSTSRAVKLALALRDRGVAAEPLHGELSKSIRAETLRRFRETDEGGVLVATDLASRGLDDFRTDYVVLYDVPYDAATYLHRVGRTARGTELGFATTLVTEKGAERALMAEIQRAQRDRTSLEGLTQGYARYRISQPSHESKVRRDAIREAGGQVANLKINSRKVDAQGVTSQMQRQLAYDNTLSVVMQLSKASQRGAAAERVK